MNKLVFALLCLCTITACSGTGGTASQPPGLPDNPEPPNNAPEPEPEPEPTVGCGYDGGVTIGIDGATRIEAENYDTCGSSFSDSDSVNEGDSYREDGVDIYADPAASNGYTVGDTAAGEYLDFSVDVERSGFYTLGYRVNPSADSTAELALSVDGLTLKGSSVSLMATTEGWADYGMNTVYLGDGPQTLRLQIESGTAALDYLELVYAEDLILAPQATVNAMGIGINLGNTLDAPYEGDWALPAQKDYLEDFSTAGFKHVRIPVTWHNHTAESAPYTIQPTFLNRVEQVVDWALAEDSYVILNAHHEAWLKENADDTALQARFDSIWQQVSERFKNKSSRLIFEMLNEPHGMSQSESDATNLRVLEIIRQTNPNRLVVFAGNDYSSADRLLVAEVPDDEYVIGNFHSYDPWPFAGQCTRRWGSDEDIAALGDIYARVKVWSEEQDVAVMVNEFGVAKYDFTAPENSCVQADRLLYLQTHANLILENGFAGTVWDDGGSFSFYNRAGGTWGEEKDILVNANP